MHCISKAEFIKLGLKKSEFSRNKTFLTKKFQPSGYVVIFFLQNETKESNLKKLL